MIQFRVPLKGQVIYAYLVEDCLGDGTNGDIQKVEGGEFKKYVRVFVRSQWGKGVDVGLHVWYKFKWSDYLLFECDLIDFVSVKWL